MSDRALLGVRYRFWTLEVRVRILVMALLLAVGIDASAQELTGSIYGRIVDPTNAPLPGVSITMAGDAIQGLRTVESEANGSYRLLYLPQGDVGYGLTTEGEVVVEEQFVVF